MGSFQQYVAEPVQIESEGGQQLSVNYESVINTEIIPTNSLKDMWIKAKKLLSTPGLVVPVPGQPCSQNRMVASEHNEPHHIACKSSGQFVCSGICPRYSTYRICQHTVAAAEATHNLQKFCQWWKKQSRSPDIDSLAMSGLPKGVAGQKGGIAKRSRRGKSRSTSTPTRTYDRTSCVIGLPGNATFNMNFGYMPQSSIGEMHQSLVLSQSSVSCTSQSSVSDLPHSSVVSQSSVGLIPQLSVESHSAVSDMPQSSVVSHSSVNLMPQPSVVSQLSDSYMPQFPASSNPYSSHGMQPYVLKFLTKQIRICAGCRFGYCNDVKVPDPPYNICVPHQEMRQITNPHTGNLQVVNSVAHYHANPSCIWIKDHTFKPESLQIPPAIDARLLQEHRIFLLQYFNI